MKKTISALTLAFYLATSLANYPSAYAANETPLLAQHPLVLSWPNELGTIQEIHKSKDPNAPFLFYIQTAHGQYDAQKKIQKLLTYLDRQTNNQLILAEGVGADTQLDPSLDAYFENSKWNDQLADDRARHGLSSGITLFLLSQYQAQNKTKVKARGIEDLKTYRSNLGLYRRVIQEKEAAQKEVRKIQENLSAISSRRVSKPLRNFLEKIYDDPQKETYQEEKIKALFAEAKNTLRLGLATPSAQEEWPGLSRLAWIRQAVSKLDHNQVRQEYQRFLKRVGSKAQAPEIAWMNPENKSNGPFIYGQLRLSLEKIVSQMPDVSFQEELNLRAYIQLQILQNEIKPEELHAEISRLSEKVIQSLIRTEEEEEIASLWQKLDFLKNIIEAQLSEGGYQEVLQRELELLPSRILKEMARYGGGTFTRKEVMQLNKAYRRSLAFYRGAKDREAGMFQGIEKNLKGQSLGILVTGGFHTPGLTHRLKQKNISYAVISPAIESVESSSIYEKSFLSREHLLTVQSIENALVYPIPANELKAHGLDPKQVLASRAADLENVFRVHGMSAIRQFNRSQFARSFDLSAGFEEGRISWRDTTKRSESRMDAAAIMLKLEKEGLVRDLSMEDVAAWVAGYDHKYATSAFILTEEFPVRNFNDIPNIFYPNQYRSWIRLEVFRERMRFYFSRPNYHWNQNLGLQFDEEKKRVVQKVYFEGDFRRKLLGTIKHMSQIEAEVKLSSSFQITWNRSNEQFVLSRTFNPDVAIDLFRSESRMSGDQSDASRAAEELLAHIDQPEPALPFWKRALSFLWWMAKPRRWMVYAVLGSTLFYAGYQYYDWINQPRSLFNTSRPPSEYTIDEEGRLAGVFVHDSSKTQLSESARFRIAFVEGRGAAFPAQKYQMGTLNIINSPTSTQDNPQVMVVVGPKDNEVFNTPIDPVIIHLDKNNSPREDDLLTLASELSGGRFQDFGFYIKMMYSILGGAGLAAALGVVSYAIYTYEQKISGNLSSARDQATLRAVREQRAQESRNEARSQQPDAVESQEFIEWSDLALNLIRDNATTLLSLKKGEDSEYSESAIKAGEALMEAFQVLGDMRIREIKNNEPFGLDGNIKERRIFIHGSDQQANHPLVEAARGLVRGAIGYKKIADHMRENNLKKLKPEEIRSLFSQAALQADLAISQTRYPANQGSIFSVAEHLRDRMYARQVLEWMGDDPDLEKLKAELKAESDKAYREALEKGEINPDKPEALNPFKQVVQILFSRSKKLDGLNKNWVSFSKGLSNLLIKVRNYPEDAELPAFIAAIMNIIGEVVRRAKVRPDVSTRQILEAQHLVEVEKMTVSMLTAFILSRYSRNDMDAVHKEIYDAIKRIKPNQHLNPFLRDQELLNRIYKNIRQADITPEAAMKMSAQGEGGTVAAIGSTPAVAGLLAASGTVTQASATGVMASDEGVLRIAGPQAVAGASQAGGQAIAVGGATDWLKIDRPHFDEEEGFITRSDELVSDMARYIESNGLESFAQTLPDKWIFNLKKSFEKKSESVAKILFYMLYLFRRESNQNKLLRSEKVRVLDKAWTAFGNRIGGSFAEAKMREEIERETLEAKAVGKKSLGVFNIEQRRALHFMALSLVGFIKSVERDESTQTLGADQKIAPKVLNAIHAGLDLAASQNSFFANIKIQFDSYYKALNLSGGKKQIPAASSALDVPKPAQPVAATKPTQSGGGILSGLFGRTKKSEPVTETGPLEPEIPKGTDFGSFLQRVQLLAQEIIDQKDSLSPARLIEKVEVLFAGENGKENALKAYRTIETKTRGDVLDKEDPLFDKLVAIGDAARALYKEVIEAEKVDRQKIAESLRTLLNHVGSFDKETLRKLDAMIKTSLQPGQASVGLDDETKAQIASGVDLLRQLLEAIKQLSVKLDAVIQAGGVGAAIPQAKKDETPAAVEGPKSENLQISERDKAIVWIQKIKDRFDPIDKTSIKFQMFNAMREDAIPAIEKAISLISIFELAKTDSEIVAQLDEAKELKQKVEQYMEMLETHIRSEVRIDLDAPDLTRVSAKWVRLVAVRWLRGWFLPEDLESQPELFVLPVKFDLSEKKISMDVAKGMLGIARKDQPSLLLDPHFAFNDGGLEIIHDVFGYRVLAVVVIRDQRDEKTLDELNVRFERAGWTTIRKASTLKEAEKMLRQMIAELGGIKEGAFQPRALVSLNGAWAQAATLKSQLPDIAITEILPATLDALAAGRGLTEMLTQLRAQFAALSTSA